jgi:hypothetical protein
VLGDDLHTLGNKVRRIETDTELTNHRDIGAGIKGFHETLRGKVSGTCQVKKMNVG